MKPKELPNLTKEFLDEYCEKLGLSRAISDEVSIMSKKIKHEMDKVGRLEATVGGYSIDIERKYEPNDDFFRLMFKKDLDHLIKFSITSNHLKAALKKLDIDDGEYYEKFSKEKDTRWLHVKKK